jgi:nitrogen fixation protein NifB
VGERFTPKYCRGEEECEPQENEARLAALLALLADVKAVFCVRIGHTPWQQLELQGIEPQVDGAWHSVAEVLPAWWQRRRQSLAASRLRQGVA